MRPRDLEGWDRKLAIINAGAALFLIVGLLITGMWQFLFYEPDQPEFAIGAARPFFKEPTGIAALHASLGDLLAGLALWITAWMSYRVVARISRTGIAAMILVAGSIISGGIIRMDAAVKDGELVDTTGYGFVFGGGYDVLIAGSRDLEPAATIAWTLAHVVGLPIAVAMVVVAFRRAQRRLDQAPPPPPSWLDNLER